jgi:hypothetical protein
MRLNVAILSLISTTFVANGFGINPHTTHIHSTRGGSSRYVRKKLIARNRQRTYDISHKYSLSRFGSKADSEIKSKVKAPKAAPEIEVSKKSDVKIVEKTAEVKSEAVDTKTKDPKVAAEVESKKAPKDDLPTNIGWDSHSAIVSYL